MKPVTLYSTLTCPFCMRAKQLLDSLQISFEEVRVDTDFDRRLEMEKLSGRRTVPQIFIGDRHVGGFDDLKVLYESGQLNDWLGN